MLWLTLQLPPLGGLLALAGAIAVVTTALGLATLAASAFDLATAPLTIPILAAVAAIAAMGVALGVLADDYKAWKSGSTGSFFDWSAIEPGVQAFKKAFADLKAIGKDAMGAIYYEAAAAWRASHGDFKGAKQAMDMSDEYVRGVASHAIHDGDKEADVASKTRANLKASGGKPTANFEDAPNATASAGGTSVGSMSLPDAIAHVEGFDATGKSKNRPTRDNNPGDIRYSPFALAHGAVGKDSAGFAIFPDADTGKRALYALLQTKGYKDKTVDQLVARYAPSSENNTGAYQASVRKLTGLAGNTPVSQALRANGYSAQLAQAGSTPTVGNGGMGGPHSSDNSTTVSNTANVQTINVITQATDAKGIAKAIGSSMNFVFPSYANTGMS